MKKLARIIAAASLLVGLLATHTPTLAQSVPDPGLLEEINKIRAIDNHAHPLPALDDGKKDEEFDIADSIPPEALPIRLRLNNSEYLAAWKDLYGYPHSDFSDAHLRELLDTKRRIKREKGDAYPAWVLDKLGTDVMFSNRFLMGKGLTAPRFRWVWHANPLLFPLNNDAIRKANPQRDEDFGTEERWLKRFMEEMKVSALPASLDDYLGKVVIPLLEARQRVGVPAVKFYAAYLRSLDFADVPESEARVIYGKYAAGGKPDAAEYKKLQDYLFRRIALECKRLDIAVHIHVGIGAGGWFHNSTASPFLLENVFNTPPLRGTKFVMIHGGLPFAAASRFLLNRENVYLDFSAQGFLTSTRELSQVLRSYLEFLPERILFGTDAYPLAHTVGWEEIGWLATRNARHALALALTGMMNDGDITRARAVELARMVLRENAIRLYGIKGL